MATGSTTDDPSSATSCRVAGAITTTLDNNLRVPFTDEFDLSYQRQFWGESSARVAYVRKMVRDHYATFNVAREGQFTVPVPATVR